MAEDTTTTPAAPATTPELSEETKRINRILNAQKNYPASLEFTRNNTTLHATPQDCKRGNLKEFKCKYMGLNEEFFVQDNLGTLCDYLGPEKLLSVLKAAVNNTFLGSTENAISEEGVFNPEVFIKGVVEFSSRGETSKDLRERQEEAQGELLKMQADAAFMAKALGQPGSAEQKRFVSTLEDLSYCASTLLSRKRS